MIGTTAAIIGAGILGAGASLVGSSKAASAAQKGADAQAAAANHAADLQDAEYQQTRNDFAPWRQTGEDALLRQANLMGLNGADPQRTTFDEFRADPGYQYTVDQAVQGVERSAAARGLEHSGRTIKAIQDRAANLADQGYGNWFNRLAGLSGTGQTATGSTASAGSTAATNEGNALMAGGAARASGYINSANAFTGGANSFTGAINSGVNNWLSYGGGGANALFPVASTPMNSYFAGGI